MNMLWFFFVAFTISLLVVLLSIPIVKAIGFQYGYVDIPSGRKIHRQPIVRIGGISICAATLAAILMVLAMGDLANLPALAVTKLGWLMLGGFAFFLVGLADDLLTLSPLLRLLMQLSIASLIWLAGIQIEFLSIPYLGLTHLGWLSLPATVIWITGVVNAINWIDGLDGLASSVSGIAATVTFAVCLYTEQFAAALVMAGMTGSLVGFLHYNFNPAQIFMGDGGPYFIGFMIAATSVIGLAKGAASLAILIPLLILAVPLLDMLVVILARLCNGRSPFVADKCHLHHRLLGIGLSHRLTVFVICALNLWAGCWAIMLVGIPNSQVILASATGLLIYVTWRAWRAAC